MLGAKAAGYHGWPIFHAYYVAEGGVLIVRWTLRRISINLEEPGQGGQPNQEKIVPLSVCLSVRL